MRVKDKATASPKAKEFAAIAEVQTPDDLTVVLKLSQPYSPLLATLASGWGAILPKKLIDGGWHYDEVELDNVILPHVMIREVFFMHLEDALGDAVLKMAQFKYGCIPVVDEARLLKGIVTQYDILCVAAQIYSEA